MYDTIWYDFKLVWTCQNLFKLVIAQHDAIYDTIWYNFKLVWTWSNLCELAWTCPKLQYDKILLNLMSITYLHMIPQTCPDMSKHVQTCPNMSRLVIILWYDLIRFYKHVQTCPDLFWTCSNLFELVQNYNRTKFY